GRAGAVLELCMQWAHADFVPALQAFVLHGNLSAQQLGSAMQILSRFGPDATAGITGAAARKLIEGIDSGQVTAGGPQDRLSALDLIESMDLDRVAGEVVQEFVQDGIPEVRLRALRTVRLFGWEQPWLFSDVWPVPSRSDRPLPERLSAISALGAQDPPD